MENTIVAVVTVILLSTCVCLVYGTDCSQVTCAKGSTCVNDPGRRGYICHCAQGAAGDTCTVNACYVSYIHIPSKKLTISQPDARNDSLNTLFDCYANCMFDMSCNYKGSTNVCTASPSENQHNAVLEDDPAYDYLEICAGCSSAQNHVKEIHEVAVHETLCWNTNTTVKAQLTCPEGQIWSDVLQPTKTVECACNGGSWPATGTYGSCNETAVTEPSTTKPETTQPEKSQQQTTQPTTQPETAQTDQTQPETKEPQTAETNITPPQTTQRDAAPATPRQSCLSISQWWTKDTSEGVMSNPIYTTVIRSYLLCAMRCTRIGGKSFSFETQTSICNVYSDESGEFDQMSILMCK